GGSSQRGPAKLPHWRVQLLVGLSKKSERQRIPADATRQRPAAHDFGQDTAIVRVVIKQSGQRKNRGPDVGVIGPGFPVDSLPSHSGADHAKPRRGDLLLHVAVIPGKAGTLDDAW